MAKEEFNQVEVIEDEEKVVQGVITARVAPNGVTKYSFALLRDFVRNGENSRTPWMTERHIDAMERVLGKIREWMNNR